MCITRGQKHTFVGVDIKFNNDSTVMLSMDKYVDAYIDIYGHEIKKWQTH